MKRLLKKSHGFIISLAFSVVCLVINNFFSINIMRSQNVNNILEATITFASIILGLSSALIGNMVSAKTEKNRFIIWYFKKVDRATFMFKVKASIVSAFMLIISSIVLLSYDILSDCLKFICTCFWVWSLSAFIIYQTSEYFLFLDILFFQDDTEDAASIQRSNNMSDEKNGKF